MDELFGEVYQELRRVASSALRQRGSAHTLQPTALVHEAWLKLSGGSSEIKERAHFLSVASLAMRQILSDHARAQRALKRGQRSSAPLAEQVVTDDGAEQEAVDLVTLDDALNKLVELNPRHARVAELRILGGLSIAEVAAEIGVSPRTVDGDWFFVRGWLRKELA